MWDKRADTVVHEREPYNAEPTRAALAGRPVTPLDTFYSRNHGPVPVLDPGAWRLVVDGLVHDALELGLADLKERFEHHTLAATLQCAGNRRAALLEVRDIPGEDPWGPCATSTARWTGARLADVLRAAGIADDAAYVAFEAPDLSDDASPPQAYGASIPTAKALADEVLLAWGMNGEDLTALHGAPVRVLVPGWIGARSVKWVSRVTAQREPSKSYFQATAYRLLPADADYDAAPPGAGLPLGSVALNCDVLVPDDRARLDAGSHQLQGYAYAGDDRGIARVEASLDGGQTWAQADLDEPLGPWCWRLWRTRLDLPPGEVRISVRAWDTSGATQPASPAEVWNPKGYANNSWGGVTLSVR